MIGSPVGGMDIEEVKIIFSFDSFNEVLIWMII